MTSKAVPEMLQTAYASRTVGLEMPPGQPLLIRGGTSGNAALAPAELRWYKRVR